MLGTLGFDIMSLLHHTADRPLQEGKCQQRGRGIAGGGAQQGRFRFPLFDEAGNVLAKALGFSRGWSQVQGTTNCKTSSIQRPASASRSRSSVLGSATCGVVLCCGAEVLMNA
jgi:hypothetical protein